MQYMAKVLVTGGAGYIGNHTCIELLMNNYEVAVVDNLVNGYEQSLHRIEQITKKKIKFFNLSILEEKKLASVFDTFAPNMVIH